MEKLFEQLLLSFGENPERAGLLKTPERAAKAFKFMTSGYSEDLDQIINNAIFPSDADEMVVVQNIEFYSMCEHHLLPFFGHCHIGYIPNGKIIGLSKIARIADVFSRRLQVQENLTQEIANCVSKYTESKGVGVIVEAKHLCMMMRGVEKQHAHMQTSCMIGNFKEDKSIREQFLSLVKSKSVSL